MESHEKHINTSRVSNIFESTISEIHVKPMRGSITQ